MVAAEMGNYLVHSPGGEVRVRAIIVDEIKDAARSGDRMRAIVLKLVLKRYLGEHPAAERREQLRPGS